MTVHKGTTMQWPQSMIKAKFTQEVHEMDFLSKSIGVLEIGMKFIFDTW